MIGVRLGLIGVDWEMDWGHDDKFESAGSDWD